MPRVLDRAPNLSKRGRTPFATRWFFLASASLALSACSTSTSDDSYYEPSPGFDSTGRPETDSWPEGDTDGGAGDGLPEDESDSGEGSGPGGTGADEGGGSDEGAPEPGFAPGCPAPWPEAWVFCEDFEDTTDPGEVFFDYQDAEGAFVLVDDLGASGVHSMKATYREGIEGAGWLSVAFGRNPIVSGSRPAYDTDRDFEEIYWRFRTKTQSGWPDLGAHRLTRATVFADANWVQAAIARLTSDGSDVVLVGDPASCVIDDTVACQEFNDQESLRWLGRIPGVSPVFSSNWSDRWICIEAHVKLNTPGQSDGEFEFWVDDALENGAYDIDWRGSWSEFGLNMVSIENLWNGGAPVPLERWIDDVVVSTEPIGCDTSESLAPR